MYCFSKSFKDIILRIMMREVNYLTDNHKTVRELSWASKSRSSETKRLNEQLLKIEKEYDLPDRSIETPSSLKRGRSNTTSKSIRVAEASMRNNFGGARKGAATPAVKKRAGNAKKPAPKRNFKVRNR